jgi:hypothetical protein
LDGLTILLAERVASLKAGIVGGTILAFSTDIFVSINYGLAVMEGDRFSSLQVTMGLDLLLRLGIAWVSGFLFAVTYRYIIRDDNNSHLKDGAVLAFSIVRCLALLEGNSHWQEDIYSLVVLSGESILGFALVRLCLDLSMKRGWLKH